MTVIHEFPADLIHVDRCKFYIGRRHLATTNPWSAFSRVQGPLDERWIADITRTREAIADWARFEAFIDELDGSAGFFTIYDPALKFPRGKAAGGNPLNLDTDNVAFDDDSFFDDGTGFTEGAGFGSVALVAPAGSEFLRIKGLQVSEASSLLKNDRFTIMLPGQSYGYLHKVQGDTASDASGEATVKIRPRLRRPVRVDQIVQFNFARGVFQLKNEEQGRVERSAPLIGQSGFSLVEAHEVLSL